MKNIILIAHNIRSSHNVGSFFRTCDGLGVNKLILTGYTPYPTTNKDNRLPHITKKLTNDIHKTALGSEKTLPFSHHDNIFQLINELKDQDYKIIALEQSPESIKLNFLIEEPCSNLAIIVGREVDGIEKEILDLVDLIVEIPMLGEKESFNVAQAAAIALYHFQYIIKV